MFEIVSEHQDLLIMFSLEDDHYDGLDAALLEALVKAQVCYLLSDLLLF